MPHEFVSADPHGTLDPFKSVVDVPYDNLRSTILEAANLNKRMTDLMDLIKNRNNGIHLHTVATDIVPFFNEERVSHISYAFSFFTHIAQHRLRYPAYANNK